jgi:ubiquinone/menaquinone biosynthesis C-methylase UbiE
MSKILIRQLEEELPTIGASMAKMDLLDQLSISLLHKHATRFLQVTKLKGYVLEVGCGDGLLLKELQHKLVANNLNYIGVDISLNKIKVAKHNSDKIKSLGSNFILADAEFLPFQDSSIASVMMVEVLEHFPKPSGYVFDITRVTVPSGQLVITTPSAYGLKGNKVSIINRLLRPAQKNENVQALRETYMIIQGKKLPHRDFTSDELKCLFSKNFTIINLHSFNFGLHSVLKNKIPYRFVLWLTIWIELQAEILPVTWGHNWLLVCKKKNVRYH